MLDRCEHLWPHTISFVWSEWLSLWQGEVYKLFSYPSHALVHIPQGLLIIYAYIITF